MKLSEFKYRIPEKYIAYYAASPRDSAKMMVLDREAQTTETKHFRNIVDHLKKGDCLVVNDTRVFPARLVARKDKTSATVEIFLLRELETDLWEVLVKPARKVRIGNKLTLNKAVSCDVIDNTVSGGRVIRFNFDGDFHKFIERFGKCPLPPYIKREPEPKDKRTYQTVFASNRGSVAAPTAALHFTKDLVTRLKRKGVKVVPVTLHIGLGTFRPVVVEDLSRHRMDSEFYEIPEATANVINAAKEKGGKVVAVGTTVVRALETSVTSLAKVKPWRGWTDKFIYPPYEFKVVDRIITNFHQPSSTLLMLTCAFAGRDFVFKAYRKAMKENYRFFSYGDAMLIL